jgi:hypothetical protein
MGVNMSFLKIFIFVEQPAVFTQPFNSAWWKLGIHDAANMMC